MAAQGAPAAGGVLWLEWRAQVLAGEHPCGVAGGVFDEGDGGDGGEVLVSENAVVLGGGRGAVGFGVHGDAAGGLVAVGWTEGIDGLLEGAEGVQDFGEALLFV